MTDEPAPTLAALLRRHRPGGPRIVPRARSRYEDEPGSLLELVDVEVPTSPDGDAAGAPPPARPDAPGADAGRRDDAATVTVETRDDETGAPAAPPDRAARATPTTPAGVEHDVAPGGVEPSPTSWAQDPAPTHVQADVPPVAAPATTDQRAPAGDRRDAAPTAPTTSRATTLQATVTAGPAAAPVPGGGAGRRQRPAPQRGGAEPAPRTEVRIGRIVVDARPAPPPPDRAVGERGGPRTRAPGPDLEAYLAEGRGRP